jgi:hypothetical protein
MQAPWVLSQSVAEQPWCPQCDLRKVRAGGLCITCYQYRRRNGTSRPERLQISEATRRVEAQLEQRAAAAHMLYARQRSQRPRLADRVEEAYRERAERRRRDRM